MQLDLLMLLNALDVHIKSYPFKFDEETLPTPPIYIINLIEMMKQDYPIKGKNVLEVGSGIGQVGYCFAYYEANVTGIDMREEAVTYARGANCLDELLRTKPNFVTGIVTSKGINQKLDLKQFDYWITWMPEGKIKMVIDCFMASSRRDSLLIINTDQLEDSRLFIQDYCKENNLNIEGFIQTFYLISKLT